MKLAVIIPAAGFSSRYAEALKAETATDLARSKLDEDLGGRPVLQRTVELFTNHDAVSSIIVAGPADPQAFTEFKTRYGDKLGLLGVKLCPGGVKHRFETVKAAISQVPDDATHIAVHDAARPCLPVELLDRLIDAAAKYPAVIPGIDVPDTLKRVGERETDDRDVDPLDAIGIVAGAFAEIVVHGPRPGVAAQAAVLGPRNDDEPCLVRIRLFRSKGASLAVKEGGL